MALLNISNLTFSYEESFENIFENVSFQIDTNWKTGFIGRNGRGKTTLLKLLGGELEYSGNITPYNFLYFPFSVKNPELSAFDIIGALAGPDVEEWEICRETGLLELPEEKLYIPYSSLSKGEQTKVLLASLFFKEDSFLLIDEPTNHLDMQAREAVARYLRSKKSFILVSHDRNFIDSCVDHILSINRADIEVQKGNFSTWFNNKQLRDNFELAENEKLEKEVRRLRSAAAAVSGFAEEVERSKYANLNSGLKVDRGFIGHRSAKMMKRSKAIESRKKAAAEKKESLLKNIERSEDVSITPLHYHSDRLLSLTDVSVRYGDNEVCRGVTFEICRGDRVALCGKNGSGKSSIIKLLLGNDISFTGHLYTGSQLKISYVSQDTSHLHGPLDEFAEANGIDRTQFFSILRKLDFERTQFEKDMEIFSEGQKKKVLIACSLCEKAHLYIWDEPLNYIDILSRIQIENLVKANNMTMLFVEHDSNFADAAATKKINLAR